MFPVNRPVLSSPLPDKLICKSKENAASAKAIRLHPSSARVMHCLSSTSYPPTVSDYVHRRVLRQAVAAICKQVGFEVVEASALELLTHMINSYISELAATTRQMTEHAGRTISTPSDTIMGLVDIGAAVTNLPAFLKEATSKGSLVIAPPRMQNSPHVQQQLRVGSLRPRPSYIPDWFPPFPDSHTYVRTEISGEPEPSYEKAREGLALLHRNTIVSLKDFVLRTNCSISLFDAHKQRIVKKISAAAEERSHQRKAERMASVEGNVDKGMMNGGQFSAVPAASEENEQLKDAKLEYVSNVLSSMFEEENETNISLLEAEVPTFGEIIEPKTNSRPFLDALLFDVQTESTSKKRIKSSGNYIADSNPFLRPPKVPSMLDDEVTLHEHE